MCCSHFGLRRGRNAYESCLTVKTHSFGARCDPSWSTANYDTREDPGSGTHDRSRRACQSCSRLAASRRAGPRRSHYDHAYRFLFCSLSGFACHGRGSRTGPAKVPALRLTDGASHCSSRVSCRKSILGMQALSRMYWHSRIEVCRIGWQVRKRSIELTSFGPKLSCPHSPRGGRMRDRRDR